MRIIYGTKEMNIEIMIRNGFSATTSLTDSFNINGIINENVTANSKVRMVYTLLNK